VQSLSDDRRRLFEELNRETRMSSSLTVLFSQAVAEHLGVHSTDVETLDLLHLIGPMTAGRLAEITGLSTGATTRLIDRMERAGFAHRLADPDDRRRVIVEWSAESAARIMPLFLPLGQRMGELWDSYSDTDLTLVLDFLRKTNQILAEENQRLREGSASHHDVA
jgi:DNA-binding MarR family transcriptional regulator